MFTNFCKTKSIAFSFFFLLSPLKLNMYENLSQCIKQIHALEKCFIPVTKTTKKIEVFN